MEVYGKTITGLGPSLHLDTATGQADGLTDTAVVRTAIAQISKQKYVKPSYFRVILRPIFVRFILFYIIDIVIHQSNENSTKMSVTAKIFEMSCVFVTYCGRLGAVLALSRSVSVTGSGSFGTQKSGICIFHSASQLHAAYSSNHMTDHDNLGP